MKVGNTNWSWLTKEEGVQHAVKSLNHIKMSVAENIDKYVLRIGRSYKYVGNTYYDLKSKDMESACNEADDIAREEFTRLVEWNTKLIQQLGDN